MTNLKDVRNELLRLHKTLMNLERENYESANGPITNVQLLTLLFEDDAFIWLREISILVAEIDELLASKQGIDSGIANSLMAKAEDLIHENSENHVFRTKYHVNLNTETSVSEHHKNLQSIFKKKKRENLKAFTLNQLL